MTRRQFLKATGYGLAVGSGVAVYANASAYDLELVQHTLTLPNWDANGFKVAVLADIHTNHALARDRAQRAIRMAIAEKPDLIVMPGDFINWPSIWPQKYLNETLTTLNDAKCPVYATLGNHDYGCNAKLVAQILEKSPAKLLVNEAVEVGGVTLAGLDDALFGSFNPRFLRDKNYSKSLLSILHEPDYCDDLSSNVSLCISGHSHGGQLCLPGGHALSTPKGAKKYIRGYYTHSAVPLYVSRGVGTTMTNLRLFSRPEVSVLTLHGS